MTRLIQHAALAEKNLPPSSLASIQRCLQLELEWVEVDIIPLRGGDFALVHDPELDHISDGLGSVTQLTAQEIKQLRYRQPDGVSTGMMLGTLSQAIQLFRDSSSKTSLQLDLKPYALLTQAVLQNLLELISPIHERVLISCVADWAVRHLRQMDTSLQLGFDPLLYLDVLSAEPRPADVPPFRVGAYGFLDDHPLAAQRWGTPADYFGLRAETLLCQVPRGLTWFLNADLLVPVLDAGFDWIAYLHENGSLVDAWTIDIDRQALAKRLVETGIDFITSNDALLLHL